jgi:hypothetical protein
MVRIQCLPLIVINFILFSKSHINIGCNFINSRVGEIQVVVIDTKGVSPSDFSPSTRVNTAILFAVHNFVVF